MWNFNGAFSGAMLDWLGHGLLRLSWWQLLLVALATTHLTIVAVTVFLHRCQTHRALELGPIPSHIFRFWLWLSTGMVTREWVAVHRKHHAKCETPDDPHSPQQRGLRTVLWRGAELYRSETTNAQTLRTYGQGTPAASTAAFRGWASRCCWRSTCCCSASLGWRCGRCRWPGFHSGPRAWSTA